MRLTTRQTGIISYAGLDEAALWEGAKRAFIRTDEAAADRFRAFLPLFPSELIVNMSYVGVHRRSSPAGFSLSEKEYHQRLSEERPELYGGDNRLRCFRPDGSFRGGAVTVDAIWAQHFPQYAPFQGERLRVYMIGGGCQAVAVPESIFPRGGGILQNAERNMGVTARCAHYCAWVRERLRLGDSYDPAQFEDDYLAQTEFRAFAIRQKNLSRVMQDVAIVRDLQRQEPAPVALYTESSRLAEGIAQYAPYRCACDTFTQEPITRQTQRLLQLYYEGDTFQSDFWLPWQEASLYLDRRKNTLDVGALCDGFQLAPATDADTRGGCYPNKVRVVSVNDRSLRPLVAQTLNNPAYGTGLSPLGTLNKLVYFANSAELLKQGKLTLESQSIVCENTRVSEEELLRMRALAEWQEHKGRLIDAMYRRESALSEMQPGTLAYTRAQDILDAKVERMTALVGSASIRSGQLSGYDSDIAYLKRLARQREGGAPLIAPDPQREASIESGFAMRNRAASFTLTELSEHTKTEAPKPRETTRKQRTASGQWFEQMDFLAGFGQEENE